MGLSPTREKHGGKKDRIKNELPLLYQNIIKSICSIKPDVIWVSDFTYLKYEDKFLYLLTFMDRFTREIVGWDISTRNTKDLIITHF